MTRGSPSRPFDAGTLTRMFLAASETTSNFRASAQVRTYLIISASLPDGCAMWANSAKWAQRSRGSSPANGSFGIGLSPWG